MTIHSGVDGMTVDEMSVDDLAWHLHEHKFRVSYSKEEICFDRFNLFCSEIKLERALEFQKWSHNLFSWISRS